MEVKKKKKRLIVPTLRMKKAFSNYIENGGNMRQALLSAGYSASTSKCPSLVTRMRGWQQLVEKYLPDKKILEKHKELLEKKEILTRNNMTTGEIETISTGEIDVQAVSKALDMFYKLKGSYSKEGITPPVLIKIDINNALNKIYGDGNSS